MRGYSAYPGGVRLPLVALLCGVLAFPVVGAPAASAKEIDATAIGDSVMLGAKWVLEKRGIKPVDAAVSRQANKGPGLVKGQGSKLPEHVVVHLGTNGTYTLDMCKDLVRAAGPSRVVHLVTIKVPRKWESVNNEMLRTCAESFSPSRVRLVDWYGVATRNPGLLYADGVHLRPEGAQAFTRMIMRSLKKASIPSTSVPEAGAVTAAQR